MNEEVKNLLKKIYALRYVLIIGILFLSANVYAWFVYVSSVNVGLDAKIRSWNVLFEFHNTPVTEEIVFNVAELYPGMAQYSDVASVSNTGETNGTLSFKVKSFELFGVTYDEDDYTSAELEEMIENDYPFLINMSLTSGSIGSGDVESFNITINWPYESGDDELDTQYGQDAYDYMQAHPTGSCIKIKVQLTVDQDNG